MPLDTNHARCVSVPSRLGCTQMTQISLPLSSLVPRATDSSSSIGLRAPPASVWHPPLLESCLVFHCTLIRAHQHPSGGKDAHIQTHCRASHSPRGSQKDLYKRLWSPRPTVPPTALGIEAINCEVQPVPPPSLLCCSHSGVFAIVGTH